MLFNSLEFVLFAILFFPVYYALQGRVRLQNGFLLVSSYVFYGWWDWRFLSLLLLSTVVDFFVARGMAATDDASRRWRLLLASLFTNLGVLGFFKYFNFFTDSAVDFLHLLGMQPDRVTLEVVLPVGISFYTFQTLSYTLDVYWRKLEPEDSFLRFALFVSFWPQLVAGPIERAGALLGQIAAPRILDWGRVHHGLHLTAWGFFKKMVIADNVAPIANSYFGAPAEHGVVFALVGTFAFTLQIFADFSGYSDIARGLAKLMGFELRLNFAMPYLSVSPSDFWTRWHISLSSWLRDYLYIPLGGNRFGSWNTYRNLVITMLLGGLWHGASWNFVLWGAFHGAILVVYRLGGAQDSALRATWARHVTSVTVMFGLTLIGWILFRCHTFAEILLVGQSIATFGGLEGQVNNSIKLLGAYGVVAVYWAIQLRGKDLAATVPRSPWVSGLVLAGFVLSTLIFGARERSEFIYFQF